MSIQNRSWFVQVTQTLSRFVTGDVPTQATFQNLIDSVPFKNDANDKSTTGQQGLIRIASDANVKSNTDPDTTYSYATQPHQMPTVSVASDTITTTPSTFSGSVLSASADSTATRNNYSLHYSSSFITWFVTLINGLDTRISSNASGLSTLSSTVSGHTTSISTINSNISTIQANVATNASDISDLQTEVIANGLSLPVGMEMDYPIDTPPNTKWKLANGQAIDRTTYASYFALIGTTYGAGDGTTTFNIPDYRGRIAVMKDGTTEFLTLGQTGGVKVMALSKANLANHVHRYVDRYVTGINGALDTPTGAASTITTTFTTEDGTLDGVGAGGTAGNGAPFSILQPYIVRSKMIKVL